MSYFDQNIKAIKERDIVLYDQVQLQQDRMIDHVMSEPAKDGNTYLKRYIRGEWIALNSTYRPLAEAERFAKAYEGLPLYARLLVFGFGNGYIARAMIAKNPLPERDTADGAYSHVRYAFYEPDYISFLYVLHTYDLTDILSNPDVRVFVEGLNGNLLAGWCNDNVAQLNVSAFSCVALPKYRECYPESYERIYGIYDDMVSCVHADTSTKQRFTKDIVYNNFRHISYFMEAYNFLDFIRNYPKELPYVIVSAGPSLKQNIDELRAMKGYAFIMSTDSAAKYLLEQEIVPDGIITIDPLKPLELFSEEMSEIPFFLTTDSNVKIVDLVQPSKMYYVGTQMAYYESLAVEQQDRIIYLDTGGSVATAAFSLAEEMGIQNIVLIGQDLSFQGKGSHVAGQDRANNIYKEIPGNEEKRVGAPFDYYMYLRWFQNHIAQNANIHVVNATMGGARIEGASYLHGEKLYKEICTQENQNRIQEIRTYLQQAAVRESNMSAEMLYHAISENIDRITEMIEQAKQNVELAEKMIEDDRMYSEEFQLVNQELENMNERIQNNVVYEWLELCAMGSEDEVIEDLYKQEADVKKDVQYAYKKMMHYYDMILGAKEMLLELLKG